MYFWLNKPSQRKQIGIFALLIAGIRDFKYIFGELEIIKPAVDPQVFYEENLNEPLMERLGEEAGKEIKTFLSKNINHLKDVDVHVEVLKGKLKEDAKWEKSLRLERPMEIHILLDAANADRKDVYKTAQKIQRLLNEERYEEGAVFDIADLVVFDIFPLKNVGINRHAFIVVSFFIQQALNLLRRFVYVMCKPPQKAAVICLI